MTKAIWKTLSVKLGQRFVQRAYNNWFPWPKEGFTWEQWKTSKKRSSAR